MRKSILSVAVFLGSAVALAGPSSSQWQIDKSHSTVTFAVKHMMVATVNGKLGPVSGVLVLDGQDVRRSKVNASIDVTGLDTGNAKRDAHLRSKDFFDVLNHPKATFTSTEVVNADKGQLRVTGVLNLRGKSKPVTLDVKLSKEVLNPFTQEPTRGVWGTTVIKRSDFGLTWQMPMANNGVLVGEEVRITFNLELVSSGS